MTIRLSVEVKEKLGRLAQDRRRSPDGLAAEAVSTFVDHELGVIDNIRRGLADLHAGRIVSHENTMDEIDAIIAAAQGDA